MISAPLIINTKEVVIKGKLKKIIDIKSFIDNLMDDLRKDFKPLRLKKKSSTKASMTPLSHR